MDLTTRFPRGPRERLAGVAMLPRTIDKARAAAAGTLGEYVYDCPMDRQLFETLSLDGETFARAVERGIDDEAVVAWLHERGAIPAGDVLERHNDAIERWAPKSDAGRARFIAAVEAIAPGRTDITTWTALLDIEEGRVAPAAS